METQLLHVRRLCASRAAHRPQIDELVDHDCRQVIFALLSLALVLLAFAFARLRRACASLESTIMRPHVHVPVRAPLVSVRRTLKVEIAS